MKDFLNLKCNGCEYTSRNYLIFFLFVWERNVIDPYCLWVEKKSKTKG